MDALTWSKQAPTEPGWYWHRKGNVKRPQMVEVRIVSEPRRHRLIQEAQYRNSFQCMSDRDKWEVVWTENVHRWAGPIPEPENH